MASQIQKPSPQCQTAVIISGFACIGKSQLSKSQATKSTPKGFYKGYKVVDLDSAGYTVDPITKEKRSSAEFVKHYIAAILPYRSQKVILMMSTHPEIRDEMCKRGLKYTLVYPNIREKAEWLRRLEKRAGKDSLYNIFDKHWIVFVGGLDKGYAIESKKGAKRVMLNKDQYLTHVVDGIINGA